MVRNGIFGYEMDMVRNDNNSTCLRSKYVHNKQKSANPCACLSSSPLLWKLINFRLFCSDDCRSKPREEKFWSDDYRSCPREEKINNHGCYGKHAHIPDNDY